VDKKGMANRREQEPSANRKQQQQRERGARQDTRPSLLMRQHHLLFRNVGL